MKTAQSIEETRMAVGAARRSGERIALVPTMGFLHEGHLSLLDLARRSGADFVVATIFVNPTQFGPAEDFERYPRDEERDRHLLQERDVDLLFAPSTIEEIYPPGFSTRVVVGGAAEPLEGERRPGHFSGVATVVLKLLNIVQPHLAVFGQKDAQQCAVVQRLVRDLDLPVEIVIGETVREPDGLAMSSRNAFLSEREREIAPTLVRALRAGRERLRDGSRSVAEIERTMHELVQRLPEIEIDYLRLVDPLTFAGPEDFERDLLLVGAIRVGRTRLIDNIPVGRQELQPALAAAASEERIEA